MKGTWIAMCRSSERGGYYLERMTKKLTCIESFAGAGGMALGMHDAGFDVRLAFDLDADAVATYQTNLDSKCIQADANEISSTEILDAAEITKGELDLFCGGPPCQGFSKQRRGAHMLDDPRNILIRDFVRFVDEIGPNAFLLENVAIFGQKRGKPYLAELASALNEYDLYPHFYNGADYGIAQTRQRFVLVGIKRSLETVFEVPEPTVDQWVTVGEALAGLPEPPEDTSCHLDFANHCKTRISKENEVRFSFVPQGGGWQDIPWEYRLKCHQVADVKSGGWPDVYGRLEWDGYCPTITGGFDSFTRGRYGHPVANRAITPREAARLQGFPDWFEFKGNRSEVRRQLGNAVPPPLAKAIGTSIASAIRAQGSAKHPAQKLNAPIQESFGI